MVKFRCTFDSGDTLSGRTDGDWLQVKSYILDTQCKIISLEISNAHGGGTIDSNCDGYFIGNKSIATMPGPVEINLAGIGYWRKHESVARIKWYNAATMELVHTEARNIEECGLCLIKNI